VNASGHAMRASASIIAAAVLLAACTTGPGFLAPDAAPQSVYGSFLAARYASSNRDVEQSARLYADALSFEPDSGLISERAFLAALLAGDFDRADAAASAAVEASGTARLTDLYLRAADLAGARLEYDAAERDRTDAFSTLIGAMLDQWLLVRDRQVDEALTQADQIASPFAAAGQLYVHRALLLERDGQNERAEGAYRAAHASLDMPDFTASLLGAFLERQGRAGEARELYRERVAAAGAYPDPDIAAALSRVESGGRAPRFPRPNQAAAVALYAPAALLTRQAPVDYSALFLRTIERLDAGFQRNSITLAEMLRELNLNDSALAVYRGVDAGPFSARAGVQAAWLSFQTGDQALAIEAAEALSEAEGSESSRLLLADMLRASAQYAQAASIYQDVIAARAAAGAEPDWRHFYYAGVSVQRTQGWLAAEPLFIAGVDAAPDEPRILNHLGYNWIVLETRVDEGFDLVSRAAELAPENGAVLDSLGWGHFKQGRVDDAVRWLEDAVERSPGDPTINWHLGDAYAAAGRDLEAQFQWRRALELDPDEREEALITRRLELGLAAGPGDLE
jgi:tetratricopeptide (TPR) repeat protein